MTLHPIPNTMNLDQFLEAVRSLPLANDQKQRFENLVLTLSPQQLPKETLSQGILTQFQLDHIRQGKIAALMVDRYLLLSELGEGGMGLVFKARDTKMDRLVALKRIHPERLESSSALARFQQEVKALAKLSHSNLVRAYDTGEDNGFHFLVMELVNGSDLAKEIQKRGAIPTPEACEWIRQAALGLQHAFEQKLVHRDIKPSNLLLSREDSTVKVTDFGLARVGVPAPVGGLTADHVAMGTADYIAPEQAESANRADIRSDIYALGCSLYQFLTGKVPFPVEGLLEKFHAHKYVIPDSLEEECPGMNPNLIATVEKMMAKNPDERYQTPLEVASALLPFCRKKKDPSQASSTSITVDQPAKVQPPNSAKPKADFPREPNNPVSDTALALSNAQTFPEPSKDSSTAVVVNISPSLAPTNQRNGMLFVGLGIGGVFVIGVVILVVLLLNKSPNINIENKNENLVAVSVTVKIDDWTSVKQPGVEIVLDGPNLNDEQKKPRQFADFQKPLDLKPGRYTLVAKKDGKELEARAFNVTDKSNQKAVQTFVAGTEETHTDTGEITRWNTEYAATKVIITQDGKHIVANGSPKRNHGPHISVHEGVDIYENKDKGKKIETQLPTDVDLIYAHPSAGVVISFFYNNSTNIAPMRAISSVDASLFRLDNIPGSCAFVSDPQRRGLPRPNSTVNSLHFSNTNRRQTRIAWSGTSDPKKFPEHIEVLTPEYQEKGEPAFKMTNPVRLPGSTGAFASDDERMIVASGKNLRFYDIDRARPTGQTYAGPKTNITCVACSPDDSHVASGDESGEVTIWDASNSNPKHVCVGHTKTVNRIEFSLDGKMVISASEDGTIRVWNVQTGAEITKYTHDGPVYTLAVSPGGRRIVSGSADKTIRLWQLPNP